MNFLTAPPLDEFNQLKNATLGSLVRDKLLSKILSGELAPGQMLREPEIVEELQVSRVPVREALRQLESMGLVISKKNCGASIRSLTEKEVEDLYNFRAVLDQFAGQQISVCSKAERENLSNSLIKLCDQMDLAIEADDTQRYYNANLQFHWSFIEAIGNEEIKKTYREIIQKLHLARFNNLKSLEHRKRSNEEHKKIAKSLRNEGTYFENSSCSELLTRHVRLALKRLKGE